MISAIFLDVRIVMRMYESDGETVKGMDRSILFLGQKKVKTKVPI